MQCVKLGKMRRDFLLTYDVILSIWSGLNHFPIRRVKVRVGLNDASAHEKTGGIWNLQIVCLVRFYAHIACCQPTTVVSIHRDQASFFDWRWHSMGWKPELAHDYARCLPHSIASLNFSLYRPRSLTQRQLNWLCKADSSPPVVK